MRKPSTQAIRSSRIDHASAVSRPSRRTLLSTCIGALLVAPSVGAWAQTAAPDAPASAPAIGTLGAVTVTAERRVENAKDVPSSVSTLSGEKLDVLNSAGEDVRFLSGRVPSLNIESSFGRAFPRFYIRGYGNTDFHLNASQPVSLVYDDVVQENPILKGFPVFDLDRVEVLAGPQGTLFGRNTPAGVVKFDSVAPSQQRGGYFNASYGRFGTVNLEGAYTAPINSDWSARLSLQSQHRDDWVTNLHAAPATSKLEGYDDNAGRFQLLYKPSTEFSALLNIHSRSLDGSSRVFRANIIQAGTGGLVPGFDPSKVYYDGINRQTLDSTGTNLRLRWELPSLGVALNSITALETVSSFSRGDVDGGAPDQATFTGFPDETADAIRDHEQLTQEFRVESIGKGPLSYQAGVYYFHEKYAIDSTVYDSTTVGNPETELQTTTQKNIAYAVFGSVNYAVVPEFKVRAGVRYTHDKKDLATDPINVLPFFDRSAGITAYTNDSKTTGDLAGTWSVTSDVNLYARAATGFRGSSIFPAGDFGPQSVARPETNTSYEAGVKADLFDKRARASLSVFHYQVRDQQLSATGVGGVNATTLYNASKVVGKGVEFNLDAYLTPMLLVTASGSYNNTRIDDPNFIVGGCGAGICTISDPKGPLIGTGPFATQSYFINGNPLPQAPKYVFNATARYGYPLADGSEIFVYTDWAYRSSVNFYLFEAPEGKGAAMTTGGLRLGYNWDNGKYELAGFARNIANQIRVVGGINFDNRTGFINEPRTVGAQFKAVF